MLSEGRPGNLIVVDENKQWSPSISEMAIKSMDSPFDGCQLTGKIKDTLVNGNVVVSNGEVQI